MRGQNICLHPSFSASSVTFRGMMAAERLNVSVKLLNTDEGEKLLLLHRL